MGKSGLILLDKIRSFYLSLVGMDYRIEKAGSQNNGRIELLQLDKSGIKVAEYMTELPKRELLE